MAYSPQWWIYADTWLAIVSHRNFREAICRKYGGLSDYVPCLCISASERFKVPLSSIVQMNMNNARRQIASPFK
jgi:hypothetical protein